ncbi:expressed unknown protein [Seminavis robusta]|uniref:Uncharacterized protein n=1 Tax=Seminavis robusta TaxID=568900 RepID=A0A9N8H492_9STRA|nr:expressed unknown protein [Seminavis robusta]|eukprot:Sro43_g026400.1 n/a (174) ;mRNA; f:143414-143935
MAMESAINDSLDYMGKRVILATAMGGLAGGCLAVHRGHSIATLANSMARSWALTATAGVATQQLAYGVLARTAWPPKTQEQKNALILASHALGGISGGSVLGFLYIQKPLRGIVLMAPLMVAVGLAEVRFQERQRQLLLLQDAEPVKPTLNVDGSRALPPPPDEHEAERGKPW